MGKRRMTQLSEAGPPPPFDFGIFSGRFGEVDRTQWQWEAPSTRPANAQDSAPSLLSWLLEWETIARKDTTSPLEHRHVKPRRQKLSFQCDEVAAFRVALENTSGNTASICHDFFQQIKQSLILGSVSEATLNHILNTIPKIIERLNLDLVEAQSLCLHLYQAVWDGLDNCKVLHTEMLHGKTLNRLLKLITQLPMAAESQDLTTRIIHSASNAQLTHMRDGLDKLVLAWIRGLVKAELSSLSGTATRETTKRTMESTEKLSHIRHPSLVSGAIIKPGLGRVIKSSLAAKMNMCDEVEKISKRGHEIGPVDGTVNSLANILACLPTSTVQAIVRSSSHHIMSGSFGIKEYPRRQYERLQCYFLSLVAQIPAVRDVHFEHLLTNTTCSIQLPFLSSIVLDQWISQGYLKDPFAVKKTFETTSSATGAKDFGTLLFAIDKHKEMCWTQVRRLVKLLSNIGEQKILHQTLLRMHEARIKLPADIMGPVIEHMSTIDARLALKLYNLYFAMRANFTPIRLECCPNFVRSMINDPSLTPETIWGFLGVTLSDSKNRSGQRVGGRSSKKLSPDRIKLINIIAVSFANSNRPPRVAFRNVEQCLRYLRRHDSPLSSTLTRAIAHSGITTKIMDGKWVPKGRMAWALQLVLQAEGVDVANTAETAIEQWNASISEKEAQWKREMNVLRVGPID
jgi:hypothetical protein